MPMGERCGFSLLVFIHHKLTAGYFALDLYLLPFKRRLHDLFTKLELDQWVNSMMERQIRIRESIEDYMDAENAEASDVGSASDDDGENELESLILDRRRLAPY